MEKPSTHCGYSNQHTKDCERVLITLFRGLGPWKNSFYLIGGLTPRYLAHTHSSTRPLHAGTLDVDLVIDLWVLVNVQAYRTLEENLGKTGFERARNDKDQELSWRWQTYTEQGTKIVLELLADDPSKAGGRIQPLPTDGRISALNIPHSSIVFDLYDTKKICAELLGEDGIVTEQVKHANLVSFTCLKALAFDQRHERKDAYDLVYCLEHALGGLDAVSSAFLEALDGKHGTVIRKSLAVLRKRFTQDDMTEGYRKDGPVAVAKFELGEEIEQRENRILRQRQASEVIEQFLAGVKLVP